MFSFVDSSASITQSTSTDNFEQFEPMDFSVASSVITSEEKVVEEIDFSDSYNFVQLSKVDDVQELEQLRFFNFHKIGNDMKKIPSKDDIKKLEANGKKLTYHDDGSIASIENKDGTYDLFLPSGQRGLMIKGKTKHAISASRKIDGDSSLYIAAMITELVTIEGNPVFIEEISESLPLKDYNFLMTKMSEANFI